MLPHVTRWKERLQVAFLTNPRVRNLMSNIFVVVLNTLCSAVYVRMFIYNIWIIWLPLEAKGLIQYFFQHWVQVKTCVLYTRFSIKLPVDIEFWAMFWISFLIFTQILMRFDSYTRHSEVYTQMIVTVLTYNHNCVTYLRLPALFSSYGSFSQMFLSSSAYFSLFVRIFVS